MRQGLSAKSASTLAAHLLQERRDPRYTALRPALQVVPCFDLYRRLQRKHDPRLSIFFTNHVASMMHRFWGDPIPGYAEAHDYAADEFTDFTDQQLGRIRKYAASHPGTVVVVSLIFADEADASSALHAAGNTTD